MNTFRDEPPSPDWSPTPDFIAESNLAWLMQRAGVPSYDALHAWSVQHREAFWGLAIERLRVRFREPYRTLLDLSPDVEQARWLPGAQLNIVESCFAAPSDALAIVHQTAGGRLYSVSYAELKALTGRVAANLRRLRYRPGDPLAILMPMTAEAVAIYLGIIAAGCVVVGIAETFSSSEIALRLRLAGAVAVLTQDVLVRGDEVLPLYAKAVEAGAPPAIVLRTQDWPAVHLRPGDHAWHEFLGIDATLDAIPRESGDAMNILFSSGTDGEPRAIPWTQITPIKAAVDAHFHHNIQPGDVLAWPSHLGSMMGPWLIFASLMNRAAIGLYDGAPTGREFAQFVERAKVTTLGVEPDWVKRWRDSGCLQGLNWSRIELFSSTGEGASTNDLRWLMVQAGGRPVIEYRGGPEIGGAYLTGTIARPCVAGTCNSPALGLDLAILDEQGNAADRGEAFLVPPSIGLSTSLLHEDHHAVYFAGTPHGANGEPLRRHGDRMERLPGGYWRAHGRMDGPMNREGSAGE